MYYDWSCTILVDILLTSEQKSAADILSAHNMAQASSTCANCQVTYLNFDEELETFETDTGYASEEEDPVQTPDDYRQFIAALDEYVLPVL